MAEPKPGVKSTEFWATIGVGGFPLAEQLGWIKNLPVTEAGEIAMWCVSGAVICTYIFSRAWVKVSNKGEFNVTQESSTNNSTADNKFGFSATGK